MASRTWKRWLSRLFSTSQTPPRKPDRKQRVRLAVEALEERLAPTTTTWTGGGGAANNLWNSSANWQTTSPGGVPANGDDLVFPDISANRSTSNNFANLAVNSITLS